MLVEFSIKNFRSIKEKQTLSMVHTTTPGHNKDRLFFETGFNAVPKLVESVAIYGPNGSGKSNLIKGMEFFKKLIEGSYMIDNVIQSPFERLTPFVFSKETINHVSEFEIAFIYDGYLFQYGFTVDQHRIYEEWLYATPQNTKKQKRQTWFVRDPDNILNSTIGKNIKGEKEVWKKSTRKDTLFLSTAVKLNSEDFLKPFAWLALNFQIYLNNNFSPWSRTHRLRELEDYHKKAQLVNFMKSFDASFDDIAITEAKPGEKEELSFPFLFPDSKQMYTIYQTMDGALQSLNFEEESEGTKNLFHFASPILNALDLGHTFVVDEINKSLHPIALKGIIALFSNKTLNKHNAQLIFTTHDTSIMTLMDRDQIWLMDKDTQGTSTLSSISEFEGRPADAIEKRYLSGRYGALPNIRNLF